MTRGVAVDLLKVANRVGTQREATEYENLAGGKVSPETASLQMIERAIESFGNNTEELSMKAPMSVSKSADLG